MHTNLDDHGDDDGAPVEHVVDGGGGEGPAEVLAVAGLGHRHDRVRHRRPDVGPEDHGHGLVETNHNLKKKEISFWENGKRVHA